MNEVANLCSKLHSKNREYAVLFGAGFSKDAGVFSAWDILIDTLKPLYIQEYKKKYTNDNIIENNELYNDINTWYSRNHNHFRIPTGWGYDEEKGVELELVYDHARKNSTGKLDVWNTLEDGSIDYDYNHMLPSTFQMDSDKYYFYVDLKSERPNGHYFPNKMYSSVYDSFEEAELAHNNLLSKINELEMNVTNINI